MAHAANVNFYHAGKPGIFHAINSAATGTSNTHYLNAGKGLNFTWFYFRHVLCSLPYSRQFFTPSIPLLNTKIK
jgi:hypothetical protein